MEMIHEKMKNAVSHFEKELSSLRTSRANPKMLDSIMVEAYGNKNPINQVGNVTVPDASTISIQVWDVSLIKNVENSIIESNLGINPQSDGNIIRLNIPKLSEERRIELSKLASQYSENAKVSIRNIRRELIEGEKKNKKDNNTSEDEYKKNVDQIQNITNEYIEKIDIITSEKKTEILKV
tara:strand:- start:604 stop:1146 length:543 start_codon:yes stop_codon:yes gene_type:complete